MKTEYNTKSESINETFPEELSIFSCQDFLTAMNPDYYDENKIGRYGQTGYIYNVHTLLEILIQAKNFLPL